MGDLNKISIVIPTKDRKADLLKCIISISNQFLKPSEVIVIDDGKLENEFITKINQIFSKSGIFFTYYKKEKPGLAESKNIGAHLAHYDLVLFIDDDVILDVEYLENLMECWRKNADKKNIAGISGIATNTRREHFLEEIFYRIFCLYSPKLWSILPWGFQTWDYEMRDETLVDWIPGYSSSFRRFIFDKFEFKPLQPGRTSLEDLEFCWRLKLSGYRFVITPFAKLKHNESLSGREKALLSGKKEGYNRCLIFNQYAKKSLKNYICFYIASLGWVLRQFIGIFVEPKYALNHLYYGIGLFLGYCNYAARNKSSY
jgi:GT2 family glycosyltransferase